MSRKDADKNITNALRLKTKYIWVARKAHAQLCRVAHGIRDAGSWMYVYKAWMQNAEGGGGPQNRSGRFAVAKNLFPMSRFQLRLSSS